MAKSKIAVVMTGEEMDLWRKTQKLIGQQVKMQQGYRKTGQESKRAGDAAKRAGQGGQQAFSQMKGMVMGVAGALGLGGGVAGALALVNKHYDLWRQNIRDVAAEANEASGDIIAFAALMEGGTKGKRVQQASALAARYGIMDRGKAFDTQQAMISGYEDYAKGIKASETIFAATQLGVDLEFAQEVETMGASQGQAPGSLLRKVYVAGQESMRDPNLLAKAGPGLKYYDDKAFGAAAAATIAGGVLRTQPLVYTKRAGQAISKTGTLADVFEKWGMADATQKERVEELNRRGLISIEKLQIAVKKATQEQTKSGEMTAGKQLDIRQAEAVADLAKNLETLNRIEAEVRLRAKPGLLVTQRADVERELPALKTSRLTDRLKATSQAWTALGPGAPKKLTEEQELYLEGFALQRLGLKKGWLGAEYYRMESGVPISDLNPMERAGMSYGSRLWLPYETQRLRQDLQAGRDPTPYPYPFVPRRGATAAGVIAQQAARYEELYPGLEKGKVEEILSDANRSGEERTRILEQMLQRMERNRQNPTLKRPDDDR